MVHGQRLRSGAFNSDASRILTWSWDSRVRLWRTTDTSPIESVMTQEAVNGVKFTKDGQRIVTWSSDGTFSLWMANDGTRIGEPIRHGQAIQDITLSFDGEQILTYGSGSDGQGSVTLWSIRDKTERLFSMPHQGAIKSVAFSNDDERILTINSHGTGFLWSTKDGALISQLPNLDGAIDGAVFSPKGEQFITWSGKIARLWQTTYGAPIGVPMALESQIWSATFNADGNRVLTWSRAGSPARLWQAWDGKEVAHPLRHDGGIYDGTFSANGELVATWSEDGTARLWRASDGEAVGIPLRHGKPINGTEISHDGHQVLTWADDGSARLWRVNQLTALSSFSHGGSIGGAALVPSEGKLLTWGKDGAVNLWRTSDATAWGSFKVHDRAITGALLSAGYGGKVLTWSEDGTAKLRPMKDGTSNGLLFPHGPRLEGALFNYKQRRILTWGLSLQGGLAKTWETDTGKMIGNPMIHPGTDMAFRATLSNDGTRVLTQGLHDAMLWRTSDGTRIGRPLRHDGQNGVDGSPILSGAAFSPDHRAVLTWAEKTTRLWSAEDGNHIGAPVQHEDVISGATFIRQGRFVLLWNHDGMVHLWPSPAAAKMHDRNSHHSDELSRYHAALAKDENHILIWNDRAAQIRSTLTGELIGEPLHHEKAIIGGMFSDDDTLILTWSGDGTARLWRATDGNGVGRVLRHDGPVMGATFADNTKNILTWTNESAYLWSAEADFDFPSDNASLLIEVLTGTAMDKFGNIRTLSGNDWITQKNKYIGIAEDHYRNCRFTHIVPAQKDHRIYNTKS